mmetsp:Transcript_31835/g.64357  ORF Transcript_31835/g.64357 Transcript_31835/m.64357 type:complete len:351 (-) Transcript_31835:484-1536(-)
MWLSSSSRALLITQLLFQLCRPSSQFSATVEQKSSPLSPAPQTTTVDNPNIQLDGSWSTAKQALRNPNCSVVSISGLDHHLSTLQSYFCGEDAPSDVDLRMRVRCCGGNGNSTNSSTEISYVDCANVYHTIVDPPSTTGWRNNNNKITTSDINNEQHNNNPNNPCIQALQELALGVHSLTDGPLQRTVTDIHMRVVCASTYSANDPPFHTDKCPLRGYVTLVGPGTEYMDSTCRPWEYVALRSLGVDGLGLVNGEGRLKMASELEFIVMKGDYYDASVPEDDISMMKKNKKKLWSRAEACVHRSPPGNNAKRVILSLDLADGGDDQEWEERGRKRNWRVGMTQRKSHLVS